MTGMGKETAWPLRFTHRVPVLGKGFVALVELSGKLLARPEADGAGVWIEGVNPGAFAVGVRTFEHAGAAIREALQAVFVDFAEEAATFADFKALVEQFFHQTDEATVNEWTAAVADVRARHLGIYDCAKAELSL
jgi:hypothetical protein